jgi:hypothetical protein
VFLCQQNTPFTTVKGFTYDVEDVVAEPIISGTKFVLPVVTENPLALKNIVGAEKPLLGQDESFKKPPVLARVPLGSTRD